MKKRLLNLLKVVLSLGLLALVLLNVGVGDALEAMRGLDWRYLAVAFVLFQSGLVIRAYRWYVLLSALGVSVAYARLVVLYFVGFFFNTFLPSGFGGDVVKMFELSQQSRRGAESVSAVLADRVVGLLASCLLALIGLVFGFRLVPVAVAAVIAALTLSILGGGWLLLQPDLWGRLPLIRRLARHERVVKLSATMLAYDGRSLLVALLVGMVFTVVLAGANLCVALALGVRISPLYFILFVPVIGTVTALPISLNGLGVRESIYVVLFTQVGVLASQATAMSLVIYVLRLCSGAIGGMLYAVSGARGLVTRADQTN
ncbi:MAG: lysylphosphatidylglycerol synthase transmembrane domain-containing protein [Chloroflexota bacterium]|nr:lysylphosphatidylglycerol synthase transmembrane domain-containing protein [Chloroflexota bacterium]